MPPTISAGADERLPVGRHDIGGHNQFGGSPHQFFRGIAEQLAESPVDAADAAVGFEHQEGVVHGVDQTVHVLLGHSDLLEVFAHPVERPRQFADLVTSREADALAEIAAADRLHPLDELPDRPGNRRGKEDTVDAAEEQNRQNEPAGAAEDVVDAPVDRLLGDADMHHSHIPFENGGGDVEDDPLFGADRLDVIRLPRSQGIDAGQFLGEPAVKGMGDDLAVTVEGEDVCQVFFADHVIVGEKLDADDRIGKKGVGRNFGEMLGNGDARVSAAPFRAGRGRSSG